MKWFVLVTVAIWGMILWKIWSGWIRPGLAPKSAVRAAVDALYDHHGEDAFDIACQCERQAWQACDSMRQGLWRRIRTEIMRRERLQGTHFRRVWTNRPD